RAPRGRRGARHRRGGGRRAVAAAAVAVWLACVAAAVMGVALRPLSGGPATPGAALTQPDAAGGSPSATAAPSTARHPAATALTAQPTVPTSAIRSSPAVVTAGTPGQTATATAAVDASAALSRAEQQVLDLTTTARERHGCRPLALDPRLARAAREHAHDMVVRHYFSHVTPDGKDPSERAMAAGFPAGAGENIAVGFPSASAVMDGWMGSKGHRANILDCGYTVIGVGYDPGTVLIGYAPGSWVQMFGTL